MMLRKTDTIDSFNQFLETIKEKAGKKEKFTLVPFDTYVGHVTTGLLLDANPLTNATYTPLGNTALYDAIVKAIALGGTSKKVVLGIITDGEENASREATKESVQSLIADRELLGWGVSYLGVSMDKWQAANIASTIGTQTFNSFQTTFGATQALADTVKAYRSA